MNGLDCLYFIVFIFRGLIFHPPDLIFSQVMRLKVKYARLCNYEWDVKFETLTVENDAIIQIRISFTNAILSYLEDDDGRKKNQIIKLRRDEKKQNLLSPIKLLLGKFNLCKQKIFIGACNCWLSETEEKLIRREESDFDVMREKWK